MEFKILKKSKNSRARLGVIETEHGVIHTPAFIPVGTQATVKGMTVEQLKAIGAESVLCNTYHLYLRPGDGVVKKMGGLHKFMSWDRPIWTDSGGFQVFSLGAALEHGVGKVANIFPGERTGILNKPSFAKASEGKEKLTKITEDGVEFRSHLDGSRHFIGPEESIKIQKNLGADLIFAFDECTSPLHDYVYTKKAMERTHRWAVRCLKTFGHRTSNAEHQALFGIVQGGLFKDLRQNSAKTIGGMNFDGIGIGGPMGMVKADIYKILDWIIPLLPENKPRHLLGMGSPEEIIKAVKSGIDTFDCVAPTRLGRNGSVLMAVGEPNLNIKSSRFSRDKSPLDKKCGCYTCQYYTRAYVCHLFRAGEMLGPILATIHNLWFMESLMKKIRKRI